MESGDCGAAGDSGIARPAPRKDDEEDCEASAQDLWMLRELRNRPHLLRGEEPEDELPRCTSLSSPSTSQNP